jgi:hypothetical protein
VAAAARWVAERHGKLDVLINNAAITYDTTAVDLRPRPSPVPVGRPASFGRAKHAQPRPAKWVPAKETRRVGDLKCRTWHKRITVTASRPTFSSWRRLIGERGGRGDNGVGASAGLVRGRRPDRQRNGRVPVPPQPPHGPWRPLQNWQPPKPLAREKIR